MSPQETFDLNWRKIVTTELLMILGAPRLREIVSLRTQDPVGMACIVGEIDRRSAGGGHAANLHSVGDNFYVGTVEVRSIKPYAKSDWNDTGIEPDFKVQGSRRQRLR
jgi:hypothetical protein